MPKLPPPSAVHPTGESSAEPPLAAAGFRAIDTFDGAVHLRWDPEAAVTTFGQMAYFIEFLKTSGLFEEWVADAPLTYRSPNAPQPRDVLGTLLLSVLAGHKRYAHINSIRNDGVNPELLGMSKVLSEDSVRRAFGDIDETACRGWLGQHLRGGFGRFDVQGLGHRRPRKRSRLRRKSSRQVTEITMQF